MVMNKGGQGKVRKGKLRLRRRVAKVTKLPVAARTHIFRRAGQLMRITTTGTGGIASGAYDGNGSQFLSSVSADSMTSCYQFGAAYIFKLSSVVDSSDFTNLYDKYKILGVKLRIIMQSNTANVGGTSVLPVISYCSDHDDAAIPSSLYQITTKAAYKTKVLGRSYIDVYIKAKPAVAMYQGTFSGYGITGQPWCNSANPDIQHYGFKFWVNNFYMPSGGMNQIEIQPTYYLALKESQ